MNNLVIAIKSEYWWQISNETKGFEYRLNTPYWRKKLVGRNYDWLILTLGYPKASDSSKRIVRKYDGYELQTITHPHFGKDPVEVFAIYAQTKVAINEVG